MNANSDSKISVLMVCLGNICRSPLAEAALRAAAEREGIEIEVDSAGTGDWHIGHPPDPRAVHVAQLLGGLDIGSLQARQIERQDFYRFDHIVAMDTANLRHLRGLMPSDSRSQLSLFLDHLPGHEGQSVADPYYGETSGFETCWHEVRAAADAFVEKLKSKSGFA